MDEVITLLSGQSNSVVAQFFVTVGVLRVVFKPLMTFLHSVVDATPTLKDNEWLAKVENSAWFQVLAWLLDYIASIKLVKGK